MRADNSPRGKDPEPCQAISSKLVLSARGPTGPRDAMSDASFQPTLETEEESMRNVPGVDASSGDETDDGFGEIEDEDVLDASPENDAHSTSDETFDEDAISDSRICLDPDDGSSGDEEESDIEASVVGNGAEKENASTEPRREPHDCSSDYEVGTDCDASSVDSSPGEEDAIMEGRLDPEYYPTRVENEPSMAEFYGDDQSIDDSEESTVQSETSEDSTFESMLNTREAPAGHASEHGEDGMNDVEEDSDDVEDVPESVVEQVPLIDPSLDVDEHQDTPDGPRDPDEGEQAQMLYNGGDTDGPTDREEPTTVTDDEASELLVETLDDAELADDEDDSANIHPDSASDDKSDGDVERDTPISTSLGAAAITPGKTDNDTDEATISGDEESGVETSFKSEEMEITFITSESAEEDASSDNNSEESFDVHMRSHLNSFTESPRRVAVDP